MFVFMFHRSVSVIYSSDLEFKLCFSLSDIYLGDNFSARAWWFTVITIFHPEIHKNNNEMLSESKIKYRHIAIRKSLLNYRNHPHFCGTFDGWYRVRMMIFFCFCFFTITPHFITVFSLQYTIHPSIIFFCFFLHLLKG